jgi:YidC/Oxa1 family membrane protein insertase
MDSSEIRRFILLFALAFVGLLLYQAWMRDYGARTPLAPISTAAQPPEAASIPVTPAMPLSNVEPQGTEQIPIETSRIADFVTVETDVLRVEISTRGGTLENLHLLRYPLTTEQPEIKFQLFKPHEPNFYVAQSGLIAGKNEPAPTDTAMFTVDKPKYVLTPGTDKFNVDLTWSNALGIKMIKRFIFTRNSYLIELNQIIENTTAAAWSARAYVQLQRSKPIESEEASFAKAYNGTAYYNAKEKFEKISFDDIAKTQLANKTMSDGWIAMVQHHFISAWVIDKTTGNTGDKTLYTNKYPNVRYAIGMYSPPIKVAPGQTFVFTDKLFVGPKLQNHLAAIAPGLDLTVDYGWLTVIAQPIFWLLDQLHYLFGNWGWAIIFLTVLIKVAFYKLSESSYKSMADMRKLTPKLQEVKDRYGDDTERLNQAMMDLYRKEKINPLGGCLPIVVQIPVFIALYWVLLESVEMRQAPFALWINNLSAPDPYFILPLIMGISMFVQQQLNPAPMDPIQAKVMMGMPLIFTIFFAFFPSGLVLYWVVNNLLSIAQQWYIVRAVENAEVDKQRSGAKFNRSK